MLSRGVNGRIKSIVFTHVSRSYGSFFSQEDRAMLIDLCNFGIRVYHLEPATNRMLMFMRRGDSGLFVPLGRRKDFANATFFGVYGSNLLEGDFAGELRRMLQGVLEIRKTSAHPLLNPAKPLALITGGGPGAMEVGNHVATELGFLSCGMFVDFGSLSRKPGSNINEQKKNPFVEAYMRCGVGGGLLVLCGAWISGSPHFGGVGGAHGSETSPNRTHSNAQGDQEVRALQQPPNAAHAERAISKQAPPSLYEVPGNSTRAGAAPRAPGGARHGGGNRAVTSQLRAG